MNKEIKIKIEHDGKVISEKQVNLKVLNLEDEADLKDLYINHYYDVQGNNVTTKMHRKALDVIRLITNYSDDEIREFSDEERFQLFRIIGAELFEKKN